MRHDSPCRATRVHMGLTQQCTLGLGHSRPHTYPPIGEAEYAALLQRVEALREERDNLVRSRIDRAACCAKVEEDRDAALAAQKRAEEALQEVQDEATRIDRSHVERIMVIAVIVEAALAPAPPAALRTPETGPAENVRAACGHVTANRGAHPLRCDVCAPTPTKNKEDPRG